MFIILGHHRSGTHLLADLLDSHPDLTSYGEVLVKGVGNHYFPVKPLAELGENEGGIVMYNQFLGASDAEENQICYRSKVIHLMRRDLTQHALSVYYMMERLRFGMETHYTEATEVEVPKVDPEIVENLKEEIKEWRDRVQAFHFSEILPVYYEDLTVGHGVKSLNQCEEMDKIFEFLGVPSKPVKTRFRKVRYLTT